MSKLAVVFPGIGYHGDKPLLYYSAKLAKELGYKVIKLSYTGFPKDIKSSKEKMKEAFDIAMSQTEEALSEVDFEKYSRVVFIMKSVGTAVGGAYAQRRRITPDMLIYTPVEGTFQFLWPQAGVVFHGTADPWAETDLVKEMSSDLRLPIHIFNEANHSLETGNALSDLQFMYEIMRMTREYLE